MAIHKLNYLLTENLLRSINDTIREIDTITCDSSYLDKPYLKKGVFVYVVSLFETSITEYLQRFWIAFPEQIPTVLKKERPGFEISQITTKIYSDEVLELFIADILTKVSYEDTDKIIGYVEKTFNVSKTKITFNQRELREIKARRNLLVHKNLIIDRMYTFLASIDPSNVGRKLEITDDYLISSCETIRNILNQIRAIAGEEFREYTQEKLLRDIWKYFFPNILNFESCFKVKNQKAEFWPNDKLYDRITSLSGSETTLLSYFILNYSPSLCNDLFDFSKCNMQIGTSKMDELVRLFDKFPLLLQG